MIIRQLFHVIPQGLILGGNATIDMDEVTGTVTFSDDIVGGISSIFSQHFEDSVVVQVDPKLLVSRAIKSGLTLSVGSVTLKVLTVDGKSANVSVNVSADGKSLSGNATIDVSGSYIYLSQLVLSGTVSGNQVNINLVPN